MGSVFGSSYAYKQRFQRTPRISEDPGDPRTLEIPEDSKDLRCSRGNPRISEVLTGPIESQKIQRVPPESKDPEGPPESQKIKRVLQNLRRSRGSPRISRDPEGPTGSQRIQRDPLKLSAALYLQFSILCFYQNPLSA